MAPGGQQSAQSRDKQAIVATLAFLALAVLWLVLISLTENLLGARIDPRWRIMRGVMFFVFAALFIYAVLKIQARQHRKQDETYEALMRQAADSIVIADLDGNF